MKRYLFWTIAAIAAASGVALCFFALSKGYKSPQKFVYDFQTLIAGVLAISAAIITLVQMRLSDRAADRRQGQVLASAMQSDLDAVRRFDVAFRVPMTVHLCAIKKLSSLSKVEKGEEQEWLEGFQTWMTEVSLLLRNIKETFPTEEWRDASMHAPYEMVVQKQLFLRTIFKATEIMAFFEEGPTASVRIGNTEGLHELAFFSKAIDLSESLLTIFQSMGSDIEEIFEILDKWEAEFEARLNERARRIWLHMPR